LIGIKVWICKGEVLGKRDLSPNVGLEVKGGQQGNTRGGGRPGDNNRRGGNQRPSGDRDRNRKRN
ncbi:MAG TPA: 30S ribosomal protein S3, partial [Saprospiraceae bacterium]|nr:30S ribosomal protein S3 [Saprospiraceae bacterium]